MNSGIAWVRPQTTKFFNEIVEPKQINTMTQLQSTTNAFTTLIPSIDLFSSLKPKSSTVLFLSDSELLKMMMLLSVAFLPLIRTNLVSTATTIQPRTEIANTSNTCGDRNRGDGVFDCNL
jgi:hypothetical protein